MIPTGSRFYIELNRVAHEKYKNGEMTLKVYRRHYFANLLNYVRVKAKETNR